jgi:hypothetical protein
MDTVRHTDTYEERERERESWVMVLSLWYARKFEVHWLKGNLRGPLEKFVDSHFYSEFELCGGAVTVPFPKYLLWQAMHFLQRSTHFSKT